MAFQGGNLEKKEIGLSIGTSGTHKNTEINESGQLQLKATSCDASGLPIYPETGSWTSDVVDLGDIFNDFEKVFVTDTKNGASSFAVLTRVSDNGQTWSDWTPIAMDGTIQSDTKRYIQVRIDLFAGFVDDVIKVSFTDFDGEYATNKEDSKTLQLKRDYEFGMTPDSTWSDEGSLHRKKITRDDWIRIDKLNVGEV